MFGILDSIADAASDFVDDPLGTSVKMATQPITDTIDILEGLTEGELREKAIMRLGADVALGMAVSELVDWYGSD